MKLLLHIYDLNNVDYAYQEIAYYQEERKLNLNILNSMGRLDFLFFVVIDDCSVTGWLYF